MSRLEQISSPANSLVKELRRAVAQGGVTGDGYCVADGYHLLEEAVRSKTEIGVVIARPDRVVTLPPLPHDTRIIEMPTALFNSVAGTGTSQGVLTLLRLPLWKERDLLRSPGLVVILDGVQDPGNAGTIVRTAEAFGATGVIFGKNSARPDNPKTLRASAGSLFRMPFLTAEYFRPLGMRLLAAMPFSETTQPVDRVDLTKPCAIVVGSEGQGISDVYAAVEQVAIPTSGVESLNAAVAASILLYEAYRQRSAATPSGGRS